jgi:hypothetical protein
MKSIPQTVSKLHLICMLNVMFKTITNMLHIFQLFYYFI